MTEEYPLWITRSLKALGGISAVVAISSGVMTCIAITAKCLFAGILLILTGIVVLCIELPFLFMCLKFAQTPSTFFENKAPWIRGMLYVFLSIWPDVLCFGLWAIFGTGCIFVTGVLYCVLSFKRKSLIKNENPNPVYSIT